MITSAFALFDAPIPLPQGGKLLTLNDAGDYILELPAKQAKEQHWQTAAEVLLNAAEHGGAAWLNFARIGMMQALYPEPERKPYRMVRDRPWLKAKKVYMD